MPSFVSALAFGVPPPPSGGQELTFKIPPEKFSVNIENQPIAITASGVISKVAAERGENVFRPKLIANLSDLQQNITQILQSQLDIRCAWFRKSGVSTRKVLWVNCFARAPIGAALREKITKALLSAMQKGTNFKATLRPVAEDYTTIRNAQFQDDGSGNLSVVLDGEIRISNEQIKVLGNQLKERLSSQGLLPPSNDADPAKLQKR